MKYLFFFLAFFLFIFLPVKIEAVFQKRNRKGYVSVGFFRFLEFILEMRDMTLEIRSIVPIFNYEYSFKTGKSRPDISEKFIISLKKQLNRIKHKFHILKRYNKINQILYKHIEISYIKTYISFSSENPAVTALMAGQAWGLIYFTLSFISYTFNLNKTNLDIKITPIFTKHEPMDIDFKSIFRLRIGHIIIASFMIIWYQLTSKSIHITLSSKCFEKGATK